LPSSLLQIFQHQKSPDQQYHKQKAQPVEVLIDERLNSGAEPGEQARHQKEPRRPAHRRGNHKNNKVDVKGPRRNGDNLIRQRRKTGGKNHPRRPVIIPPPGGQKFLLSETGYVRKTKQRQPAVVTPREPEPVSDAIAQDAPQYAGRRTAQRKTPPLAPAAQRQRRQQHVRRHRKK